MNRTLFYRLQRGLVRALVAVMLTALLAPAFGHAVYAASAGALGFTAAEQTTSEGGTAYTVEVRRTGGTSGLVRVDFAVTGGTAVVGQDYKSSGSSGTLTFTNANVLRTFAITPINNYKVDGDRTVVITLSNPTDGAALGTISTVVLTIADDERAEAGTVQFAQPSQTVYGQHSFSGDEFILTRTPGAVGSTTVSIDGVDGTANSGDYELATRQVTFAEGETEKKVFVHFLSYDETDADKTFRLVLKAADGGASIGDVSAMDILLVSSHASSGGEISLSPETTDVYESAGQYEVKVARQSVTANVYAGASVDYEIVPGTASAGSDYTPVTGTLLFGDNEREQTISVPIVDDSDSEGDESFTVKLSNAAGGAALGSASSLDVTIMDNDDAPQAGAIEFAQAEYSFAEPAYDANYNSDARMKSVPVTIRRTGGSDLPATVHIATSDGTARNDHEYKSTAETVSFAAGVSVQTVMIPIYTTDADKSFHVSLSDPEGGASLGPAAEADVGIVDKGFDGPEIFFPSPTAGYNENQFDDGYDNYIRVNFDYGYIPFSVDYTVTDGTAKNGEDYILDSGTLHMDGDIYAEIAFHILEDNLKEPDETFTVKLSNPTDGYKLGDPDTVTVKIVDNGPDPNPGFIFIDPNQLEQYGLTYNTSAEENSGELTVYVYRLQDYGWDQNVSVDYAAAASGSGPGYAKEGTDFEAVSGTLEFAPGETVKTVVIPIANDNLDERTESFQFNLSNAGGGVIPITDSLPLQILDTDDVVPAGKFQVPAALNTDETAGTVSVDVTRVDGSTGSATVDYATSDGTASAGQDYEAAGGTLTFGPGETTKTITVPIDDDTEHEGDETFRVTLSNPTGGSALVEGASATEVTIAASDAPQYPGSFYFDTPTYMALEESGPIHMKVLRKNGLDGAATVHYSITPVTATPGQDYAETSGTLTFADGKNQQSFDIDIIDDSLSEGPESFILKLSDPTGGANLATPSERVVTIYDKDNVSIPPGELQVQPTLTANESDGTASLTVTRVNGSKGVVTVDYATSDGSATAASDYSSATGTLTFADGEWSKRVDIPILNDAVEEGNEQFTLTLSNPTGGAKLTSGAAATVVTIPSNDHYGSFGFDTPTYMALEESGPIHMKVLRKSGTQGAATVHYSITPVTAVPGQDYTDLSGTLTFADGKDQQSFDIDLLDDSLPEGPETFILKLSDPTGGARLGTPSERLITIYDKDAIQ